MKSEKINEIVGNLFLVKNNKELHEDLMSMYWNAITIGNVEPKYIDNLTATFSAISKLLFELEAIKNQR